MPPITHADYTGILDRDVTRALILSEMPNLAPVYTMLEAGERRKRTLSEKFEWQVSSVSAVRTLIDNVGAAYDAATTTLVVDSTTGIYPDAQVLCEATGEVIHVTSITNATTMVVVRGIGSVIAGAAGSVANNASLQVIAHAAGEGGVAPNERHATVSTKSNWVQQYKYAVAISGRAAAVAAKTEDERLRQRQVKLREAVQGAERSFLFGAGDNDTTGSESKRVTSSAGLFQAISTNVLAQGGTMTWLAFDNFLRDYGFVAGHDEKWLMAGPTLQGTLHELFKGKMDVANLSEAAGLDIKRYHSPYGAVNIVLNRAFKGVYAGHGLLLDRDQLFARDLEREQGGMMHLVPDIQEKAEDAKRDMWCGEFGLEWGDETRHAKITGVTGPA